MIIVKLNGGLGNQMFQYAIARHLALLNRSSLLFDIDLLLHNTVENYRGFQLRVFNISGKTVTKRKHFGKDINHEKLNNFFHVNEKKVFHFDESVLELRGDIYLEGYWQSEKYFTDIRNVFLKEFVIKTRINKINKDILESIRKSNAVCVHVRRGDYISNLNTYSNHGFCSLQYYKDANTMIVDKTQNPKFFIFSDDPAWCKSSLSFISPSCIVDVNPPNKGYEDLRLMMNCKHFIIANSSFSWWGAWLSKNTNKIVIAPKQWFKLKHKWGDYTKDLFPKEWIQIDSQK